MMLKNFSDEVLSQTQELDNLGLLDNLKELKKKYRPII